MQDRPRSTSKTGLIIVLACAAAFILLVGGYQFGKSLAKADNAQQAAATPLAR